MLARFLTYVEIKTKITSVFAFSMTLSFLFYQKQAIHWGLTLLFFGSMFLFDLTATAINNYIDTKTNDQILPFSRKTALAILMTLFAISTVLGLYLAYQTDWVVLLVGGLCFLCGVVYTAGPIPISRQPWGEIFSGLFYGLLIPFLLLYINLPKNTMVELSVQWETILLRVHVEPFVTLFLLSVAPICTTANIMLANNICDVEKDILSKRYTLPYYLGKKASLNLFAILYYSTYIATVLMVLLGILHPVCLLSLLTLFWVQKNIGVFREMQVKEKTFARSIQNYLLIMGAQTLLIFISGFLV